MKAKFLRQIFEYELCYKNSFIKRYLYYDKKEDAVAMGRKLLRQGYWVRIKELNVVNNT